MAKPLGIVAMLTLLISGPALADNHIEKSDVKQIEFTKTQIIFKLKNDNIFRGDIVNPRHCPIKKHGVKYGFHDRIHNSFVVYHNAGFNTCRFRNLEKLA